jgi:hypothetical protein
MKTLAIAAVAAVLSVGAVAGASAGDVADRPALWSAQSAQTERAHGLTPTIPVNPQTVVAPSYSRDGHLPGDAVARKAPGPVVGGSTPVAPVYSRSGHLPGDTL